MALISNVIKPVFKNVINSIYDGVPRFVYNFDGVDDRGSLQFKAINPDGDNTFEFWKPTNACTIIAQNISGTESAREFQLWQDASGELNVFFGGVNTRISTVAEGYIAGRKYFLSLVGNTATLARDTPQNVIRTTAFTRGGAREPTAQTIIGARGAGTGAFAGFFQGVFYDLKINGTLWPIADRNQSIQLPQPSGLGAELITPTVLGNPDSKGTQWSYLGDGRWQYVGDGSLNGLRFISFGSQPVQGFLKFEVESITGEMTSSISPSVGRFTTTGVYCRFYTDVGASNANLFELKRFGTSVARCIIKNISFKPLGSCNPLTLVNTTSDRWQEIVE